jgi:hypothetical protein
MWPRNVSQEGHRSPVPAGSDGRDPPNHVFVDLDVERQGNLLCDSRTAPVGITLLHFDDRMDEFCAWSFRAGLPMAIRGEQHPILSLAHGLMKA